MGGGVVGWGGFTVHGALPNAALWPPFLLLCIECEMIVIQVRSEGSPSMKAPHHGRTEE